MVEYAREAGQSRGHILGERENTQFDERISSGKAVLVKGIAIRSFPLQSLCRPLVEKLGFSSNKSDSADTIQLRTLVISGAAADDDPK